MSQLVPYALTEECGPYGPRATIIEDDHAMVKYAHRYLISLCTWGGSDKRYVTQDGKVFLSYEFPLKEWNEVKRYLSNCFGNPMTTKEQIATLF